MLSSPSGIIETSEGFISSIVLRSTLIIGVGVEHVGVDDQVVAVEVDDPAGDDVAVVVAMTTAPYWSLITLLGSTIDSSRSRAEPAGDAGQVGADAAPFVVEAVAGEAGGRGEQAAAAVEVALAVQARLDDRHQLVERPVLDERPRRVQRRAATFWPGCASRIGFSAAFSASVSVGDGVGLDRAGGSRGSCCRRCSSAACQEPAEVLPRGGRASSRS